MRSRAAAAAAISLGLWACNRPAEQETAGNRTQAPQPVQPAPASPNETVPAIPPPATGPDAKTPLAEPKGAIDPKSVEGAGQVVQHFGALMEQGRFSEAAKLWGDAEAAADFLKQLKPGARLQIGGLGPTEGAAGSIYTNVPVVFYGTGFRRTADVILQRVNDVPGSTEAQRRWHIERIEWRKR